jgi:RNA polymerase sigma-70 factor (ECF subfamily)
MAVELQSSRLAARQSGGELVLLQDQDRSLWDRSRIESGLAALGKARDSGCDSPLRWQAEISACHAVAADWPSTSWSAILVCYDQLRRVQPTPVVALNRAVALAMRDGPARGLRALDELDLESTGTLDKYHLYWAARRSRRLPGEVFPL